MERRITEHPVIDVPERDTVKFTWNGKDLNGYKDEMISSALIANGIDVFGHGLTSVLKMAPV